MPDLSKIHPLFYQTVNTLQPLTKAAWADFAKLLEERNLKKGEYLIKDGHKAYQCFFLTEGILRVFYNKADNEYNKTFFVPGTFPATLTALITQTPAQVNLQALTQSKVLAFSYARFKALFAQHRCIESLLLKIHEQVWIKKERHDIRMVTNDATTNYLIFQKEFPGLEQLIPQYHIASFLGITPIQLSRIRAKLVKENKVP